MREASGLPLNKNKKEYNMSDYDLFSAMQEGSEPLARYKKTILGKVHVLALNPFSDAPEGVILEGDGKDSYIELWTSKQLVFFEKMNGGKPNSHIQAGRIVKMEKAPVPPPPSPNQLTESDIDKLLKGPYLTLKHKLEDFTDTAPVLRILNRARELEKSEKIIKHLEEKISQIELEKYEQ
jgi:hypothetical protein